jgi:tRNA-splicing endonuclease subunit Sen2
MTAQRRVDRKIQKHIKAAERDAEKLLAATLGASERGSTIGSPALGPKVTTLPSVVEDTDVPEEELDAIVEGVEDADVEVPVERDDVEAEEAERPAPPPLWQLDVEHTQLQPEEAFFLLFALPCLSLQFSDPFAPLPSTSSPPPPLSILQAWSLFLSSSSPAPSAGLSDTRLARYDNPFLIQYAVYHHFRSLGWVVRSGIKFCTDWVLYGPGGPVGGHAE